MTSFIIDSHKTRNVAQSWKEEPAFCAFCRIIENGAKAYKVYENDNVIAILDILPIRRGHLLVIPKPHYQRLSDLPPHIASALGAAVSKVANALTQAINSTALNVVCNQEYAQAVPHVHYHIVPAPSLSAATSSMLSLPAPTSTEEMHRREYLGREELDDEEAQVITQAIRSKL
ncbi:HIT-like protein [Hysterangium stoloniferum]|nr:HIT-like protein [Hysterangium stoloniferum]